MSTFLVDSYYILGVPYFAVPILLPVNSTPMSFGGIFENLTLI